MWTACTTAGTSLPSSPATCEILDRFRSTLTTLISIAAAPVRLAAQDPRVELDHVFITVQSGAEAEIAALRTAGFTVDSTVSRHEGQGTASVAVMFGNAYLELIWPDPTVPVEPQHEEAAQWFRGADAWRTSGRSPFGLGLHRMPGDTASLPVPVELEPAEWLEPGAAYELLRQPSDSLAAEFFVVPPISAVPSWIERLRERRPDLLQHPGGGDEIALVRVHGPPEHQPAAFRALRPARIEMVPGSEPLLELHLTAGGGQRTDLRPVLPLMVVR
jgi:hypothetical protein